MRSRSLVALLALLTAFPVGAQTVTPIDLLPASGALTGAERVPVVQGSTTVKTTTGAIAALASLAGVTSFNTRTGAVTLSSGDVTGALTFTPPSYTGTPTSTHCAEWSAAGVLEDSGGGCGGSSGVSSFNTRTGAVTLTSGDVTGALTYTPVNPSSLGGAAVLNVGTAAGTVAAGNDSRFSGPTQNSQSAAYTFVLADAGGQVYHPPADTTARTWTIPANASVAYAIGTKLDLVNDCSAGVITLAVTSDVLVFFPAGSTGSRSIAACGEATLTKVGSTRWILVGVGIT